MNDNKNKPIVIGIGELLWDIFPDGKQIGGAPANFTYHCQFLGADSYLISRVGPDDLGKEAVKIIRNKGINTDYIDIDEKHPTGVATVEIDKNGKPNFTIHKEVAWDYISLDYNTYNLVKKADAVCFGTLASRHRISQNTILKLLDKVSSKCLRVFDINLRQEFYSKNLIYKPEKHKLLIS